MMGKLEFAVEEDAYPADDVFSASLYSRLYDHAIWEGNIDGIRYSILVSVVEMQHF
jgi:hypothetical protein